MGKCLDCKHTAICKYKDIITGTARSATDEIAKTKREYPNVITININSIFIDISTAIMESCRYFEERNHKNE